MREFQDDLIAVNSARLQALGVIQPDAASAFVCFGEGAAALMREALGASTRNMSKPLTFCSIAAARRMVGLVITARFSNHPRRPIASLSQKVAQAGQTPPFQGRCSPSLWPRPANLRRHRFAGRVKALKELAEVGRDEILAAAAKLWEASKEPTQSAVLKRMKEAERKEAPHGAWALP
jgi:hypothetical protein